MKIISEIKLIQVYIHIKQCIANLDLLKKEYVDISYRQTSLK